MDETPTTLSYREFSKRDSDPWRLTCPVGHTSLQTRNCGYNCTTCGQMYSHLRDSRTGELIRPEQKDGYQTRISPPNQ